MIKIVFVSVILASCVNVFAVSGKTPPPSNGSGSVQCAWYDSGKHEEHSPHFSQRECLSSGHGSCQEQCYTYDQVCTVEGRHSEYVKDSNGNPIMKDIVNTYTGRDRDMWRAQEIALNNCRRSGIYQDSCSIRSCTEEANRIR